MDQFAKETLPISLEEEMRRSYLDYAMSVIVGRALPDVRDGLKPVHRRILFAMHEANIQWNRPYVKCARVVGDVMGKFHPHGDNAIYDTLVRMAQHFSLRYPLIDGQGNFGSVDGDNPAAMRYTECRLERITTELLADIDKETVDFGPNYDGKELEPLVLPARIPNLLINGSAGIAVGMATNIPPHNLTDVIEACLKVLHEPDVELEALIDIVQAPDFPTRGIIHGLAGVREGYRTGRGRVVIRARTHFEDIDRGQRQAIVVDELPYQVNKALLQVRINDLMKDKRIEGIAEVRDESDKSGMRLVIELKRGEVPEVVLNTLFKETQMQDSFGMNMVALVDGQPKLLDLKGFLDAFVRHRREVVTRRTVFELRKARERGHILEGLAVALSNVDEIIELIRAAPTPAEAKAALTARRWRSALVESMLERAGAASFRPDGLDETFGAGAEGYRLSDVQAQRILEMQLQRLTGLEQDKILAEYREVMDNISDLLDILARPERVTTIVGDELVQIRTQYGDARRSEITLDTAEIGIEDLITPKDMVVTLSHSGWIKAQPSDDYRAQKRGGRGRRAATVKDADFIETLFAAHSHDTVLAFSNLGKAYSIKVYELPSGGSGSKGKPVVNVFPLEQERGEKITVSLPVPQFDDGHYVFMVTAQGTVKKTSLANFANVRKSGIIAVDLDDGDVLIGAAITGGTHDIMLFADGGKAVRFAEEDVRPMGRTARGVRGMRLPDGRRIISLVVTTDPTQTVLTATENGYGKRTPVADYPRHGRGTQGTIAIQLSERNGKLVGARLVDAVDEVMLITSNGVLIRTPVAPIRELGRNTQGVTLINLDDGDRLVGLERVADREDADALDGDGLAEGATAGDAGPGDDTVGHAVSPDAGSDGVTDGDGSDDA